MTYDCELKMYWSLLNPCYPRSLQANKQQNLTYFILIPPNCTNINVDLWSKNNNIDTNTNSTVTRLLDRAIKCPRDKNTKSTYTFRPQWAKWNEVERDAEVSDKFNISSLWFNQIRVRSSNKQMQTCKVLPRAMYASWTNYGAKKATRFPCMCVLVAMLRSLLHARPATLNFSFHFSMLLFDEMQNVCCNSSVEQRAIVDGRSSKEIAHRINSVLPKSDCIFHKLRALSI